MKSWPLGNCWCPGAHCHRLQERSPSSRDKLPKFVQGAYTSPSLGQTSELLTATGISLRHELNLIYKVPEPLPLGTQQWSRAMGACTEPTVLLQAASAGSRDKGEHNLHLHERVHAVNSAVSVCAITHSPLHQP